MNKRIIVVPPVIALLGSAWIVSAVSRYAADGRSFRGMIGYHYSVPEMGFSYVPGGVRIEYWAFTFPATVTLGLLFLSALIAVVRQRRQRAATEIFALLLFHAFCALGFLLIYVLYWAEAASVFI